MIRMKQWLHAGWVALLGAMLAVGLILPVTAFADSKADLQYVQEVCQQYRQQKTASMTAHITFLSAVAKAEGNIALQGTLQPSMLLEGSANGSYMLVIGMNKTVNVPFYLEQSDKQLTLYYKQLKDWQKMEIPFSGQEYAKMLQSDVKLQGIKDVKVVADNGVERTLNITIDGNAVKKELRKGLSSQMKIPANLTPEKKKHMQEEQKQQKLVMDKICDAMRDYNLTWVVDKSTRQLKRESMDLTPILRESAGGILAVAGKKIPADQQEVLQRMVDSCSLQLDVIHQPVKAGTEVVIPAEVKQARLVQPKAKTMGQIKL